MTVKQLSAFLLLTLALGGAAGVGAHEAGHEAGRPVPALAAVAPLVSPQPTGTSQPGSTDPGADGSPSSTDPGTDFATAGPA